jgi:hypothetical protein
MKAINIALKKIGNEPKWEFLEIENDAGNSIAIGHWVAADDFGEMKIRITEQDFIDYAKPE